MCFYASTHNAMVKSYFHRFTNDSGVYYAIFALLVPYLYKSDYLWGVEDGKDEVVGNRSNNSSYNPLSRFCIR
jgi:hypothetical protein